MSTKPREDQFAAQQEAIRSVSEQLTEVRATGEELAHQLAAQQAEFVERQAGFRATCERLGEQLAAQQAEFVERQAGFSATCERLGEQLAAKNEQLAAHQAALRDLGNQLEQARRFVGIGGWELVAEVRRRAWRKLVPVSKLGRPSQAR